jgi:hypothetical protein
MDLVGVQLSGHCTIQHKATIIHQWLPCCGPCGALLLGGAAAVSCGASVAVAVCCVNTGHLVLPLSIIIII